MPNINLKDGRKRDARVRAESVGERATVRYVDPAGNDVRLRKVLRATADYGYDVLKARHGGEDEHLAAALIADDTDIDFERIGMFLAGESRVFVNRAGDVVYHISETEIVRGPDGQEKERRPRKRPEPNTDSEIPVSWTGRLLKKDEALRRFMFSSKLQIVHVNGLTYDFLYGMAKELHEANSLMLLGAGASGKEPLIFTRNATPHRGFLEGRVQGETYVLLLHLSKMELKRPVEAEAPAAVVQPAAAVAVEAADARALAAPPSSERLPIAAKAETSSTAANSARPARRKPTVRDVVAATASQLELPSAAKPELAPVIEQAKAAKVEAKTRQTRNKRDRVTPTEGPAAQARADAAAGTGQTEVAGRTDGSAPKSAGKRPGTPKRQSRAKPAATP